MFSFKTKKQVHILHYAHICLLRYARIIKPVGQIKKDGAQLLLLNSSPIPYSGPGAPFDLLIQALQPVVTPLS